MTKINIDKYTFSLYKSAKIQNGTKAYNNDKMLIATSMGLCFCKTNSMAKTKETITARTAKLRNAKNPNAFNIREAINIPAANTDILISFFAKAPFNSKNARHPIARAIIVKTTSPQKNAMTNGSIIRAPFIR